MKTLKYTILSLSVTLSSCVDFLDVVPDNIATLDNAFANAPMAEKYLVTCFSYMPSFADTQFMLLCDEFWTEYPRSAYYDPSVARSMAFGNQNTVSPGYNFWDGLNSGKALFVGIRTCNIFLEKVEEVPVSTFDFLWSEEGKTFTQKEWWIAEVKFLKAFYHYWLLRMYGPIPLIRENLPVSASVDAVQVPREQVDDCFDYIVSLLDEAIPNLPQSLVRPATEAGHITREIGMSLKAKVLMEAASPLFNGNTDYASFINPENNEPFFNQTFDSEKWVKAAEAWRTAVAEAETQGHELFRFQPMPTDKVNDSLRVHMNIRGSMSEGNLNLNREGVWLDMAQNVKYFQERNMLCFDSRFSSTFQPLIVLDPTLKVAEQFYTDHGVLMEEDEEWLSSGKYADRYKLRTSTYEDRYIIKQGEVTAGLNYDREARFYGNLAFDRCQWFGNGRFDKEDMWTLRTRNGDPMAAGGVPITGYGGRKVINYQSAMKETAGGEITSSNYGWPVIRLADMYLSLAEALNEAYGPSNEVYEYIDKVRDRAGLEGVVASYTKYAVASAKNKYSTQDGLRSIIHQERLIELYNEGHRYWDIRRWKRAKEMWHNKPIQGWNYLAREPELYYQIMTHHTPQFNSKDYLYPIREYDLNVNQRLVQNPGWE